MAPTTYADVLARNIRSARTRIDLGQDSLAARMRVLGFGAWIRQTVSSTERGRRRPTAEEIFGLSFALETTIARLMAPTEEDKVVEFPSGEAISVDAVRLSVAGKIGYNSRAWEDDEIVMRAAPANLAEEPSPAWLRPAGQQPVVAAIVTRGRSVLVTQRRDGKPPWGFVSGEVEPGEQPVIAAVREVKEETGLEVRAGHIIGERDHPATGRHMVYLAARPVRGARIRAIVGDEAELTWAGWVGLDEALRRLPDMYEPVREYLAAELGGAEA